MSIWRCKEVEAGSWTSTVTSPPKHKLPSQDVCDPARSARATDPTTRGARLRCARARPGPVAIGEPGHVHARPPVEVEATADRRRRPRRDHPPTPSLCAKPSTCRPTARPQDARQSSYRRSFALAAASGTRTEPSTPRTPDHRQLARTLSARSLMAKKRSHRWLRFRSFVADTEIKRVPLLCRSRPRLRSET